MMIHQRHGEGTCDCPRFRALVRVGPAPIGGHAPLFLLVSPAPEAVRSLRQVVRRAGLRPDLVLYGRNMMMHLDSYPAATLAVDEQRIGPVPVSDEWTQTAYERGVVVLMVGTVAMPVDMDPDVYLDRSGGKVFTGLVPVAGATDTVGQCNATLPLPGPPSGLLLPPGPAGAVEGQ